MMKEAFAPILAFCAFVFSICATIFMFACVSFTICSVIKIFNR